MQRTGQHPALAAGAHQWDALADEALEDALYDSQAMRTFAGIDLSVEAVPDATTEEARGAGALVCRAGDQPCVAVGQRIGRGTVYDDAEQHGDRDDSDSVIGSPVRRSRTWDRCRDQAMGKPSAPQHSIATLSSKWWAQAIEKFST